MRKKKVIIIVSITILVSPVLVFFLQPLSAWFVFRDDKICNTEILKELNYSNNEYKIVLYLLDCGATASVKINVRRLEYDKDLPKELGNIFYAWYPGVRDFDISWEDEKTLIIVHSCERSDIYRAENYFGDIRIKYQSTVQ